MKRHRAVATIVCIRAVAAVLVLSCALTAAGAEKALFLKDTFPDGFKLKEAVRFYNQGDLYEYIDGQAVFYISYGFKRLEHGVYVSGGKEYTVDVYELASRLSAFGAYRQQRDESSGELGAGVEGSTIEYLTTFYKGSSYIEIIPADSESEDVPMMKKLAGHVAAAIPGETELPPEVGLFPQKDLIAGSERYVDENLLSYSVMGRGLTAHYNQGGDTELRVFLALPTDQKAARKVYDGFIEKIKNTSLQKLEKTEGIKGETPYQGEAMMYLRDRFVFGCLNVKNEENARKILEALYANLKKQYLLD